MTKRGCTGKRAYTKEEAIAAVNRLRRTQAALMNAYRCRWCKLPNGSRAWHIGHRH